MTGEGAAMAAVAVVWIAFLFVGAVVLIVRMRDEWLGFWPNPRTLLIVGVSLNVGLVIGRIASELLVSLLWR